MRMTSALLFCCILLLCSTAWASAAWAEEDHDRARAEVLAGRAVPLEEILERARAAYPGSSVLDTEVEGEHDTIVYEIKLLTADGRLVKLVYDSRDGRLLQGRGHGTGGHR